MLLVLSFLITEFFNVLFLVTLGVLSQLAGNGVKQTYFGL